MRRLVCTFLIFLSLFQWSWAGVHAAAELSHAVVHAAVDATVTTHALELAPDCAAQSHCCHPHSVGVPGEIATTHFSIMGADIAEHLALRPAEVSSNDIDRPKWLPASMAVAVL